MKLYAIAINALVRRAGHVRVETRAAVNIANSRAETRGLGIQLAEENWPLSEGWYSHACSACAVPDSAIREFLSGKWALGTSTHTDEDAHLELKIGIAYYLVGCFPAVPYETAMRLASEMVEVMLEAVREVEGEEASNE